MQNKYIVIGRKPFSKSSLCVRTCIRKGNEYSEFFNCETRVKQGENVSPYLFSLYLNDLELFFLRK
jgi:hypothetical protein